MTFIAAFHPDAHVRRAGKSEAGVTLADFRAANPTVPLVDGEFFQLDTDRLIIMNEKGEGNLANLDDYSELVSAFKNSPARQDGKVYSLDVPVEAYLELDDMSPSPIDNSQGIPIGFKVVDGVQVWQYRGKTTEEIKQDNIRAALKKIDELESKITNRRFREAVLGTDNGWLAKQENLIQIERNKLGGD
jgi:hypothetical protein